MAKKKTTKKVPAKNSKSPGRYIPILLIILVSLLIVRVLVQLRHNRLEHMQTIMSQKVTPTQSYQLDTENDGEYTYTDSQYEIKFSYPNKIFTSQVKYVDYLDTSGWAQQEWTGKSLVLGFGTGNRVSDSYEQLINMKEGQITGTHDLNYIQKFKNINTNIPGTVFYYTETDSSTDVKSTSYAYHFLWKAPSSQNSYSITLGTDNKTILENNRAMFIKIINSIEFD